MITTKLIATCLEATLTKLVFLRLGFSRVVLGSQQNKEEDTEISIYLQAHTAPTRHQGPRREVLVTEEEP